MAGGRRALAGLLRRAASTTVSSSAAESACAAPLARLGTDAACSASFVPCRSFAAGQLLARRARVYVGLLLQNRTRLSAMVARADGQTSSPPLCGGFVSTNGAQKVHSGRHTPVGFWQFVQPGPLHAGRALRVVPTLGSIAGPFSSSIGSSRQISVASLQPSDV